MELTEMSQTVHTYQLPAVAVVAVLMVLVVRYTTIIEEVVIMVRVMTTRMYGAGRYSSMNDANEMNEMCCS